MKMISVKMTEEVCYINENFILCVFICLNTNVFMFYLISMLETTDINNKGFYLWVQNKSYLSK